MKRPINRIIQPDIDRFCSTFTAPDVRRIRSIMLRKTKDGCKVLMTEVAYDADVSESFVKYCYENGLLKGYWCQGSPVWFYRNLQLIVDNT